MERRSSHPATTIVLACLCLSACKLVEKDTADYEPRAVAEVREAQRRADGTPEKVTRQQAMAEYRKCMRKPSSERGTCRQWMDLAYPPSSHVLHDAPKPPAPRGNHAPNTKELRDAMHAPVETFKP